MEDHHVSGIHCGPNEALRFTAWLLTVVLALALLSTLTFGGVS